MSWTFCVRFSQYFQIDIFKGGPRDPFFLDHELGVPDKFSCVPPNGKKTGKMSLCFQISVTHAQTFDVRNAKLECILIKSFFCISKRKRLPPLLNDSFHHLIQSRYFFCVPATYSISICASQFLFLRKILIFSVDKILVISAYGCIAVNPAEGDRMPCIKAYYKKCLEALAILHKPKC